MSQPPESSWGPPQPDPAAAPTPPPYPADGLPRPPETAARNGAPYPAPDPAHPTAPLPAHPAPPHPAHPAPAHPANPAQVGDRQPVPYPADAAYQPTPDAPQMPYPSDTAYPPGFAFPPPSTPHRTGLARSARVVLLAFGAVLVLCLGGGTVAAFTLRDRFAALVDTSDTTLVTPETLAGRPRLTDPDTQARAEEMIASLNQQLPNATSTVLAVYGDPTQRDLILVGGSADTMSDPAGSLDQFRNGMRDAGLPLTGVKTVEPGPLGGVAQCGDADAGDVSMGICLWADRGSLGMVIMYFRTAAQAASEFVQIRGAIEKRT